MLNKGSELEKHLHNETTINEDSKIGFMDKKEYTNTPKENSMDISMARDRWHRRNMDSSVHADQASINYVAALLNVISLSDDEVERLNTINTQRNAKIAELRDLIAYHDTEIERLDNLIEPLIIQIVDQKDQNCGETLESDCAETMPGPADILHVAPVEQGVTMTQGARIIVLLEAINRKGSAINFDTAALANKFS